LAIQTRDSLHIFYNTSWFFLKLIVAFHINDVKPKYGSAWPIYSKIMRSKN
jgi:hypothetical protein